MKKSRQSEVNGKKKPTLYEPKNLPELDKSVVELDHLKDVLEVELNISIDTDIIAIKSGYSWETFSENRYLPVLHRPAIRHPLIHQWFANLLLQDACTQLAQTLVDEFRLPSITMTTYERQLHAAVLAAHTDFRIGDGERAELVLVEHVLQLRELLGYLASRLLDNSSLLHPSFGCFKINGGEEGVPYFRCSAGVIYIPLGGKARSLPKGYPVKVLSQLNEAMVRMLYRIFYQTDDVKGPLCFITLDEYRKLVMPHARTFEEFTTLTRTSRYMFSAHMHNEPMNSKLKLLNADSVPEKCICYASWVYSLS